ncbi:MAG: FAD-dependent oxidoreductase [Lachnospiraceae bacterium]|nr:FAD-dependent oxidoreductase [Lachnospiraceae bacterium]
MLKPTDGTENHLWLICTDRGEFGCFGLLAATGAHPRMVGFEGEEEFRGHGVAYCATCDGEFFTGKEIFVVGGGFAAAEESVFLTKYASHVTILVREPDFTCAKATADAARQHDRITVLVNTEVEAVTGGTSVTAIRYVNNETGERTEYTAPEGESIGVFVFAGYEPATELFRGVLELDKQGYIVTDRNQRTSAEGIYAAGDVCVKNLRQVVTAVGDGATAATELEKYAAKMQKQTGIVPKIKEVPVGAGKSRPEAQSTAQNIYDVEKEEDNHWRERGQDRKNKRPYEKVKRMGAGIDNRAEIGSEAESRSKTKNGNRAENGNARTMWEKTGMTSGSDSLFDEDTLAQLADVFDRMEQNLILELHPDDRPISLELEEYMNILAAMTEKLTVKTVKDSGRDKEKQLSAMTFHSEEKQNGGYLNPEEKQNGGYLNPEQKQNGGYSNSEAQEKISGSVDDESLPYVRILRADGTDTGLAFHGVPGGHEFTPFVLSLFNAAGPGQKIDRELEKRIAAISRPAHMKIMVSLTCEVCPDLVTAAQRIAAGNPYVTAEVYDFAHFPQMSEEYHVLSVPCLIVNEDYVTFGKKTMKQLLDILETIA